MTERSGESAHNLTGVWDGTYSYGPGIPSVAFVATLIESGLENAIKSRRVTYDLARQMPGATELSTSAFGDQIIKGMTA